MFIRHLVILNACPEHLQHAIPRLAGWSQAGLPRYLDPADVERIIAACNIGTSLGVRDRAVMLLLARLGLRAGEVSGLRLEDVDWESARVRVSGKTGRPTWLPLPQDVGDAILHYIKTARPAVNNDGLFLISCAPYTQIISRQVCETAQRAILQSGVKTRSLGAHQFRHSAATAWLRKGMTLQAVGALLRHRDLDTTAIYAKVDVDLLRRVAQPWPQGNSSC
jgi:site-specific recombinase XerD